MIIGNLLSILIFSSNLLFARADYSVNYSELANILLLSENMLVWHKELKLEPTDEDKAHIEMINHLKEKYKGEPLTILDANLFPLTLQSESLDQISNAIYSADTIPAVSKLLIKFTTEEERKALAAALNHFKGRLSNELKESDLLKSRAKDLEKILEKEKMKQLLRKLQTFLQPKAKSGNSIEIILQYSPLNMAPTFESKGRFLIIKMNPIQGFGQLNNTELLGKLITHTIGAMPGTFKENLSKIFFSKCLTLPKVTPETLFQIPFTLTWSVLMQKEQTDKKSFDPYMSVSQDPWISFMTRELYFILSDVMKKRESIENTLVEKAAKLCFEQKGMGSLF